MLLGFCCFNVYFYVLVQGTALRVIKGLFMLFLLILGPFWCSEVTSVTFSSYLREGYNKKKSSSFDYQDKGGG